MKSNLKSIISLLSLCMFAAGGHAASFTPGNIVVTQYGDGSAALAATATNVFILEYLPSTASQSTPVQTIAIPSTGSTRLTVAGSSTSEGFITRSTTGNAIVFGGYDADAGTPSVAGTSAATTNRVVGVINASGTYTRVAGGSSTMYSAANIRSVVSDGINYWMAGSSGGAWYSAAGGVPVQVGGTSNMRVIRIYNGTLYYTTGSGTVGLYAWSGLPTAAPTVTNLVFASTGTSPSPYDFAINSAGTVIYLADDRTLANGGGIQKWTFNGSAWTLNFTFGSANGLTVGCRGLAVDFSGANPVLYATDTTTATRLIALTDTSAFSDTSDSVDQVTVLATAGSNRAFRGVALAPLNVSSAPVIVSQPPDTNIVTGTSVTLAANVLGTAPLAYQWYYTNTNTKLVDGASGFGGTISGSTNSSLTLTAVDPGQAGGYQIIITNASGSVTSRVAQLTITSAFPPSITNQPASVTVNAGDPFGFSITVGGSNPLSYQWKVDNGVTTNLVVGSGFTGTNSITLTNSTAITSFNGLKYFCTITNAYGVTNTAKATLTVNPAQAISIADFRAKVNGSYAPTNTTSIYTITGIVTTTTNMTSSTTSSEFFMQDNTAGIAVFWSGAVPTNIPPAGALVQVTAPMASFNGLIEIQPVVGNLAHSVVVISSNNPVPAAQPLPMDPNVTFDQLKTKIEGLYVVVSNVTLAAGATFGTSVAEYVTNNNTHAGLTAGNPAFTFTNHAGDVFTTFYSSFGGLAGLPKPSGPVTIYGVLTFSSLNTGSQGFEFVPLDYAHVISYISTTNVMTNARKGDAPTNTYTENVLRQGETLTANITIGDPEGGSVTLTPVTDGLPASASWTVLNNGIVARAKFTFTPTSTDAGSKYLVSIGVNSTSGNQFTNTETVYVPTADEQKMAITEFLANPTTNTSAPHFNPLQRATDTVGVSTNDQYIEVANPSGSDLAPGWTLDFGTSSLLFDSYAVGAGVSVPASSSVVVYSGGAVAPGLTTPVYASTRTGGLGLLTSGSSKIILRNANGNIVDRMVYNASDESTNGSLTRFPTINDAFVAQNFVSTNHVTPGAQYDGGTWSSPTSVPQGVNNVTVSAANNQIILHFTANTTKASTLWRSDDLTSPFSVVNGGQFGSPSATFTETNTRSKAFYYISTQQ